MLTEQIDESVRSTLAGNTRPEAATATDLGAAPAGLAMSHLLLQLKRSPAQEAAFEKTIDALHDPASPSFHRWLSPADVAQFGLSQTDIAKITAWLTSYGFSVNVVYGNGVLIDFSGSAGQVRKAFRTEIHTFDVAGARHIANVGDPQIPAALAPAVEGIVSLHDFKPHSKKKPRSEYTYSSNGTYEAVVPADLATIYNLNPAFTAGFTGSGQTVVVIEDTDVYSAADWTKFRNTFGLNTYTSGSFVQVHPAPQTGTNNCGAPGVVSGDESEAELDAEWASASAPNATIELAACASTNITFGGLIAFQNVIAQPSHPAIISISYGECEAYNGAAANASYYSAYQQAVAEGVSVFVSSGDEGAASCDADEANAVHGIGVSGFASTPYNVAVGGTDFGDTYYGDTSNYWRPTNGAKFGSAKSYIPEIPWNDSCASALIAISSGDSPAYGSSGFCNSTAGRDDYITTASGSGGPSGCAKGAPSVGGVVSGTCAGYAMPSWQQALGNQSKKVREIPDVSLFAANGVWGHYYVYCDTDARDGESCSGAPSNWSGAGGTSFSSPILAGIQALVNEYNGGPQGNPNPVYYNLAAAEYGPNGNTLCQSINKKAPASTCVFNNVVKGDIDVNCTGTHNCYLPSGSYGVLSRTDASFETAFGTNAGWNFATGLGTVNASNLITSWSSGFPPMRRPKAAAVAGP